MKRLDSENSNLGNVEPGRSFSALTSVIFGFAVNSLVFLFHWLLGLIRGQYGLDEGDYIYALLLDHIWVLVSITNSAIVTVSIRRARQVNPLVGTLCFMLMLIPAYAALVPWYWRDDESFRQNFIHFLPISIGFPILYGGSWWLAIPVAKQWPPEWKSWPILLVVVGVFTAFFFLTVWK